MPRTTWVVGVVLGLVVGGCELIAGTEDLQQTMDGVSMGEASVGSDSTLQDGPDAAGDARNADGSPDVMETGMAPPDGPSMLPETGTVEAGLVPDSCVKQPEDCQNGVDDDCNGLIDCADPTCQTRGYACVPPWPSGWTPVALYDQEAAPSGPAPTPPSCSGDPNYANLLAFGYYNPVPTAATCTCGSCGSPSLSATCSDPVLGFSAGCPTSTAYGSATVGTTCGTISARQGGINAIGIATASTPSGGGTCAAASMTPNIPTWDPSSSASWEGAGRVCGPTQAPGTLTGPAVGCATAGDYCLLEPATKLVCIYQAGQTSCPTSAAPLYSSQHSYNTSGTDNRKCAGSCSCSFDSSGLACSTTVSVYDDGDAGCSGTAATVTPSSTCASVSNFHQYMSAVATLTPTGGSCAASGNYSLMGSITPGGTQTTVCCIP
jgi:hypothetical protein